MRPRASHLLVVLLAVVLTLAGCAQSGQDSRTVTVGHSMGRTVIDGVPTRIVALGTQWLDATEVLGVQPIGYLDDVRVATGNNGPWEPPQLSAATPVDPKGNVVAQVAALQPDLILTSTIDDKSTIGELGKIAPTVPRLSREQVQSWSDQVTVLGRILNREDRSRQVVADVDARIDASVHKFPTLRGRTFATAYYATPAEMTVFADPRDPASALFIRFGLTPAPNLVAAVGPAGHATFPVDRIRELSADLVGVAVANPELESAFRAIPGFADLPATTRNSIGFFDVPVAIGLDELSPLSVPYVLDRIDPLLTAASAS